MRNILCLGDSLTFGYGSLKTNKWTELLKTQTDDKVINEGINGDTTSGMLDRSLEIITSEDPDIITILGGTNDLLVGASVESITENLKLLCKEALENNIITILISPPPVFAVMAKKLWAPDINYNLLNQRISELNKMLKDFCADKHSIHFISLFDEFKEKIAPGSEAIYYTDGLHQSIEGHKLIFNILSKHLISF